MERVFRAIAVTVCGWIYPLIPPLYEVFYELASARYFTDSTINDLASNLYILVSVVMLFTFAIQLIKAIVNPDLLTDKQKGMVNVFKRSVIAMVLIVGVPIAFNEIYKMQGQVLENHLIEKIVVGFNSGDTKPGDTNVGQVLAASTIVDLLYPVEGATTTSSNLPTYYNDMITKDIKNIDKVGLYINERYSPSGEEVTDDDPYVFEFKPLVAIVAGGLVLYFMVIFSMDMGVRLLKLALLELTAPISIMAYIYGGDDNLKRWTKEVGTTFLEVYIKIGIISFIIFMLNNIDSFGTRVQSNHPWMIKIFILIGLFTLAGKLPDLIKTLFGVTYTPKGGIGGRLGAMVGPVGKIAQSGWDKVKKGAGTVALGVGGVGAAVGTLGVPGAIGTAAGVGLAHHGWNKGFKNEWLSKLTGKDMSARAGKDTGVGVALRSAGAFLGAGNPISGISAASKVYSDSGLGKSGQILKQQAAVQKIKDNAKTNAINAANSQYAGLVFNSGANRGNVDTTSLLSITDDFKTMSNNIIANSNVPQKAQQNVTKFVEAKHDKAVADNDVNRYNQMVSSIERLKATTKSDNAMRQFESLLSNINNGGMDATAIRNSIESALRTDGYSHSQARTISNTVENYAKNITVDASGHLKSEQTYIDAQTNKSIAFSAAENNFNAYKDTLDEKTKAEVSSVVGTMDKISKEKVKNNKK